MAQNSRLFRWTFAAVFAVAVVWVLLTLPAGAEWPQNAFSCASYRQDLYWHNWARRHCPDWRWRQWRRWRTQQVPYASGDALCQTLVESTGEQAQTETVARDNALVAWRGRVRFKYGERFTEFKHSRDQRSVCAPSSIPDAYRDQKLPPLYRCEISARPCRVEARRLGKDDD
jgi:hypothetical protein